MKKNRLGLIFICIIVAILVFAFLIFGFNNTNVKSQKPMTISNSTLQSPENVLFTSPNDRYGFYNFNANCSSINLIKYVKENGKWSEIPLGSVDAAEAKDINGQLMLRVGKKDSVITLYTDALYSFESDGFDFKDTGMGFCTFMERQKDISLNSPIVLFGAFANDKENTSMTSNDNLDNFKDLPCDKALVFAISFEK